MNTSVSIIIPTYNEARNMPMLLSKLDSVCRKADIIYECIIVDDGSPDGTAEAVRSLSHTYPIVLIERSKKIGLGNAVRAGFAAAKNNIIGVMDGDLSHDPAVIPQLIGLLERHDIAIASRFLDGSAVESWNPWRRWLSLAGVGMARQITHVFDPLSGFFFFRSSVIDGVVLQTNGYKILFEILVKGIYKTAGECPYTFRMRRHSMSKLSLLEYLRFLLQVVAYRWYRMRHRG